MIVKTGWIRDIPDHRDYAITKAGLGVEPPPVTSPAFDNRKYCSNIQQQIAVDCSSNATASLSEYLQKKIYGKYVDLSRLFIFHFARVMDGDIPSTVGSTLRSSIKTLVDVGVCEERYWKYELDNVDLTPSVTALGMAKEFKGANYYRLDAPEQTATSTLAWMKYAVSLELPLVLGFACYSSATEANKGRIPFPSQGEVYVGGHAIMICGFNDNETITNPNDGNTVKGAFLIQNSWGYTWGNGFGYLPYDFILKGLTADIWALLNIEWLGGDI